MLNIDAIDLEAAETARRHLPKALAGKQDDRLVVHHAMLVRGLVKCARRYGSSPYDRRALESSVLRMRRADALAE